MRILRNVAIGIAGLAGLLFLIGLFLPEATHMERSVRVNAPAEEVYQLVNDLPSWTKWSPWYEMEPTAEMTYSTPASGKGSWYAWDGQELGRGKLMITDAVAGSRIDTEMEFEGQGGAEADFFFEPNEDGTTTVTWAFDTEHENVMGRWFGVMLDRMLGPDYEKGVTNLKRVAEG